MTRLGALAPLSEANQAQLIIVLVALVAIFAILLTRVAVAPRRRRPGDLRFGPNVVVRCRQGHLFTTTWIPMISVKAVRLGPVRLQYCPVGRHWAFVTMVRDSDLTDSQRRMAEHFNDGGLP